MYKKRSNSQLKIFPLTNNELTTVGPVSAADGKAVWKGFWGPVCVRLKKAILNCMRRTHCALLL